jgi:3',5'-cyclic AMP phosphodiesterase CpdA
MKLYVASDIHLEFGDLTLENRDDVDVLILSGDICVAADIGRPDPNNILEGSRSNRVRDFFRRVSCDFPEVVYIMGNHEHYHGDFAKTQSQLQDMFVAEGLGNIHLLEKSTWQYQDYWFIGGTLWTDFNSRDALTLYHSKSMMNDFRGVKNSHVPFYKFIPEHALEDHMRMKNYIATVIDNRRAQGERSDRVIVVGHHAPSQLSVHEKYQGNDIMNGCYRSNMEEFILDRPEICLWTHGHTHEDFDYMIGTTRVVCSPRGYIHYESRADTWQPKLIEL